MEGVQPRIDDAQGNRKRERIGADCARPRPLAEYLAVDRPADRENEKIHERQNRPEREIDDNHRAEPSNVGRADPNRHTNKQCDKEQAYGEKRNLPAMSLIISLTCF